ncbi:MAG TPA: FAD-dependent oxidoreductase [Gemmatimonadales bacterium]|nr:FAD-dependent oxidoreductase [Gemmatimonadales bacterium]
MSPAQRSPGMDRRSWLKTAGTTALGLAATAACGAADPWERFAGAPEPRRHMARVLVSHARVIRSVGGLRPFRPSGFVVRAERRDSKLIVHHYGHGGGGITLSWGTAQLALEEAQPTGLRTAAVLGAGAVGLATARLLQRHGWLVTIYARELPPDTTSNLAGGVWAPYSVFDEERLTPEFEARYVRAARIAYQAFQQLAGARYGVHWLESYRLHDLPLPRTRLGDELRDLFPDSRELAPKEHPFPAAHVLRSMGMLVEPFTYMNAVLQDFLLAGGRVVVREFVAAEEVMALAEPVVVNCTGLGAKALFGDDELIPIKGQLCVLVPQPEVDYVVSTADGLYMMPRQDGIVLGGTHERGVWDLAVSQAATERILAGNARLFGSA